jgi:hypothetical protein
VGPSLYKKKMGEKRHQNNRFTTFALCVGGFSTHATGTRSMGFLQKAIPENF